MIYTRLLALTVAIAFPARTTAANPTPRTFRRTARYEESQQECLHGQVKGATGQGVLISFNDELARTRVAVTRRTGDTITKRYTNLPAVAADVNRHTIDELLADDGVNWVEADCVIKLDDSKPGDIEDDGTPPTRGDVQPVWGLDRIDQESLPLDGAYNYGSGLGVGSRIYILDTGVRIDHTDFTTGGVRAFAGWSAECETGSESGCGGSWLHEGVINGGDSCSGHGTHCASSAAGYEYGVAKGARIITVQVLSCQGSGSLSGVIAGVDWAVTNAKAHPNERSVISMSLGGGRSNLENQAIDAAHDQGINVVVAAGNDNRDACNYSPASAPKAITVGSTMSNDAKSSFSNWGSCVDIHAPGSSIKAAWPTSTTATNTISGTSMACPHVAGATAIIRAAKPNLNSNEVTEFLLCSATDGVISGLNSACSAPPLGSQLPRA